LTGNACACACVAATILLASTPYPSCAQDATAPPRPRIGLALGGGAARGFAHIGILKWFDEHRIPIDDVAGSSMGGLVGGAFAAGMSPGEVEALVASLRWDVMLASSAPFADKDARRKQDARDYVSQMAFGLRGGFTLPRGLSTGQPVEVVLGRIAMPYYAISNFDDLPTPYRAVAVDLRKSEVVVFDRGWLAEAMRATMALPGVFPPVVAGGRLLVDGGVLNNVPADVVSDMGADVVIAVDVSADLAHEARAESIIGVLGDTLNVMLRGLTRASLERANLVLAPDLKGMFGTDFDRAPEFIQRGYAAAEARKADLLPYALSDSAYRAYLASRASRRRTELPAPAFAEVEGVTGAQASQIRTRFLPFVARPLDEAGIEKQLSALIGTERYTTATYRLAVEGGRTGLMITVTPKTYGPPFLLVALDLRSDPSTGIAATARGRIVAMDVAGAGNEARIDVAAGTEMGVGAEWYRPMGRTGLFLAPRGGVERRQFNVYDAARFRAESRESNYRIACDVGYTSGNRFETRVGYAAEHLDRATTVGDRLLPDLNGVQTYFSGTLRYDGQNGAVIPDRGAFVQGRIRRFVETAKSAPTSLVAAADPADLLMADIDSTWFAQAGTHGRVFVRAAGGTAFGSTTLINAFTLGGSFSLGALNDGELRGSEFALVDAGYLHRLYRFAEGAAGSLWIGGWVESGGAADRLSTSAIKTNFSGGMIIETPLGPILAAASVGVDGRYRFYASLGNVLPSAR